MKPKNGLKMLKSAVNAKHLKPQFSIVKQLKCPRKADHITKQKSSHPLKMIVTQLAHKGVKI